MKKKDIRICMVVVLMLTLCSSCSASEYANDDYPKCADGYAEYKPVFLWREPPGEDQVIIDETKMNAELIENVKFVLDVEGVKYKVVNDKVMVDCEAWEKRQYMANITTYANDENWLRRARIDVSTLKTEAGVEVQVYNSITKEFLKKVEFPFEGVGELSIDGRWVIFRKVPFFEIVPPHAKTGPVEVIVLDPNTGEQIGRATLDKSDEDLGVSPDGKQILIYQELPYGKDEGYIKKRIDLVPVSQNP